MLHYVYRFMGEDERLKELHPDDEMFQIERAWKGGRWELYAAESRRYVNPYITANNYWHRGGKSRFSKGLLLGEEVYEGTLLQRLWTIRPRITLLEVLTFIGLLLIYLGWRGF